MNKNFGFSLLELIVTLAIIGILSAIAYPAYTHHVVKTHRKQVQITLHNLANRLERYYIENNHSYADATPTKLGLDETALKNFYEISIPTATTTAYKLQAKPIGNQAIHDVQCGTLSLDQRGEEKITGNGSVSECW